jgi:plasmid stabilization system protein ParE
LPHVTWSIAALRHLGRVHDFLAVESPGAAGRAVSLLRASAARLAAFPEIGRPIDALEGEFREWIVPFGQGAYLMRYRRDGDRVVILAIRHSREAGYEL